MTLRDLLIKHEGIKGKVYYDTEGIATIGVGRNLEDVGVSVDEALLMLDNDIKRVLYDCWHEFRWFADLDEDRQNVVASMVFNLGLEGFKKFKKMIAAIEKDDFTEAACQMVDSKWAAQVKKRAVELAVMMKGDAA
jgi:lysozyme